jgi:hypothetical protein
MNEQHPITPSPELVQQWINTDDGSGLFAEPLATRAAQWGADQELEACCGWVQGNISSPEAAELRAARRPKPPSLKQQALLQLDTLNADLAMHGRGCDLSQIRRALEALDDSP